MLDGYAEVRVHHPRSPGRRTDVLVLVLVAGVPTEEIVYGIGARHTRSRLHDVHHRLPPRAALGQLLAVRYGRGGSVLDGGSVLVLAVAMDLTQVMRWAARTSLVVFRGPRAGVRGHHRSTQRPAEKLKDLVHQLLRRAALHGAHLLPLSRPNVPGFLLEELHELAPVVALLGDARCRRVEAVQGDFIGVVPGYDLGEHVAVRQVPGASKGVEGRVSTRSNFRDACQKKSASRTDARGIAHLLAFLICDSRSRERIHFNCTLGRAAPGSREPPSAPGMSGSARFYSGVFGSPERCQRGLISPCL